MYNMIWYDDMDMTRDRVKDRNNVRVDLNPQIIQPVDYGTLWLLTCNHRDMCTSTHTHVYIAIAAIYGYFP